MVNHCQDSADSLLLGQNFFTKSNQNHPLIDQTRCRWGCSKNNTVIKSLNPSTYTNNFKIALLVQKLREGVNKKTLNL